MTSLTERVNFRVTPEQLEKLRKAAKEAGETSLSKFLRIASLNSSKNKEFLTALQQQPIINDLDWISRNIQGAIEDITPETTEYLMRLAFKMEQGVKKLKA